MPKRNRQNCKHISGGVFLLADKLLKSHPGYPVSFTIWVYPYTDRVSNNQIEEAARILIDSGYIIEEGDALSMKFHKANW